MSLNCTQRQLCTGTSISLLVQCQISIRLLSLSVTTFISWDNHLSEYIYEYMWVYITCAYKFKIKCCCWRFKDCPMVSRFYSVICIAYPWLMKAYRWNQRAICHSADTIIGTSVIIRWIVCFILFYLFFNFISGPNGSFSRKVISYKSDSSTAVALFWKLESSLQETAATQAIFKNESFQKGVMLVPKLVLSNTLLSWREKEFLNILETTKVVQPKLVWNY